MLRNGTKTDHRLDAQLVLQHLFHFPGHFFQVRRSSGRGDLLDHCHIGLIDTQHKVLTLVGEQTRQHIHRSHICMAHLTNQEHHPGCIGNEMQLLCPNVNITGQDVIHDNIFDKGAPVMLLFIEVLGIIQCDIGHHTAAAGRFIRTGAKHSVLKCTRATEDRLEAFLIELNDGLYSTCNLYSCIRPVLTQQCHVGAGNNTALAINYAEHPLGNIS